jgi:hypothetical protein
MKQEVKETIETGGVLLLANITTWILYLQAISYLTAAMLSSVTFVWIFVQTCKFVLTWRREERARKELARQQPDQSSRDPSPLK